MNTVSHELKWSKTPLHRYFSRRRFVACVQVFDFTILLLLGFIWIDAISRNAPYRTWIVDTIAPVLVAATVHCVFQCFRLYDFSVLSNGSEAARRALCAGIVSLSTFLLPPLIQADITSAQIADIGLFVVCVLGGFVLTRLAVGRFATALKRSGVVDRRIYIIAGSSQCARSLGMRLMQVPDNRIVGTAFLPNESAPADVALEGAIAFLRDNPVDVVILRLPLSQSGRLVDIARILRALPLTVQLAPDLDIAEDLHLTQSGSFAGRRDRQGDIMLVNLSDRPLSGWDWLRKDLQDRTLALILLAILLPVMLAITVAIKLSDPGPVFFRQKRYGYGGGTFEIFKFRTMRAAPAEEDSKSLRLTTRGDPRVFPVGRILRKTSLDELPQLLNVILGDMWIIGPRPHSPYAKAAGRIYRDAIKDYAARYRIKPGITGWAQVCGWRGPTETLEQLRNRVEHDLYYIENWSTLFDLRILLKTLFCAFGHDNAF